MYNKQQKQSETEEQKAARIQKTAETKRKNKAKSAAAATFFEPRSATHAATTTKQNDSTDVDIANDTTTVGGAMVKWPKYFYPLILMKIGG